MPGTLVWDRFVRISHWLVALLFLADFWLLEAGEEAHEWAGYGIVLLLVMRLVWGVIGKGNARLRELWPSPARIRAHLRHFAAPVPAGAGHNPLGAAMILFLWFTLLLTAVTGWLQTTDRYWGEEWVQDLHNWSADLVMAAVVVHIAAVIIMPRINGAALIRPMITGYRNPLPPDERRL